MTKDLLFLLSVGVMAFPAIAFWRYHLHNEECRKGICRRDGY